MSSDYRRDPGRPRNDEPAAPSVPETVKIPEDLWILLRKIAKYRHASKHAIFREALDEYAERHKRLAEGITLGSDD